MKKRWATLLLCIAMILTVVPMAFAAEIEDSGFCNIGSAERVDIVPITADGEPVTAVSRNVDGESGDEQFYPGSQALRVTVSDTVPGRMYLLTVSAGDTVYYADQQTGGGTVTFEVAFLLPDSQTNMLLSIGSNAEDFTKQSIPLSYMPEAEGNPDYRDCPKDFSCVMADYSDLDPDGWYHDGVHYVLENQIMNGVGGYRFDPGGPTSRAMIVTMLWRVEGEPKSGDTMTFRDVPEGLWYTEAVRWAASEHIVDGYSTERFAPNDNVSREQLATILWRYAKYQGTDLSTTGKVNLGIYLDEEHISSWAHDGMQWAVNAGLITGVGNDKLSPETDASRAQVATILMRYSNMILSFAHSSRFLRDYQSGQPHPPVLYPH